MTSMPEVGRLAEPHVTHQMMYSHPALVGVDAEKRLVRGVLCGIEEQGSADAPTISAHCVRGLSYEQHMRDLTNAYAESVGQGPVDDENAQILGSVKLDGVDRTPLLFTTEFPESDTSERKIQIQLWLGRVTDPPYRDMNRLAFVRNSLVHVAAVALQGALESDLEDVDITCIVDCASVDVRRECLNTTAHGYTALREELANTPAPEIVLPPHPTSQ